MSGRVVILGAGVVGLACGLSLQRAGFHVTLVDRDGPGEGASAGNAGQIATASIIPQSVPGILRQTLRMLRDRTGPLVARPAYVARNLPWFLRFLSYGDAARMEAGAEAMAALMARAHAGWAPLLASAGAEALVRRTGLLHVFGAEATLRAAAPAYALRRRLGIEAEVLDARAAREREPALREGIAGAVFLPDIAHVADPLLLSQRMAAAIEAGGGQILRVEARGLDARGVTTAEGRIEADRIVLAAGVWSRRFAGQLGVRVPLVSERGYHRMLPPDASPLSRPALLVERKVALTPMRSGLRLASIAEFARPEAPGDHGRVAPVFTGLERFVQGLDAPPISRWVGSRPVTPDSRPVIGPAPGAENVIMAFGHGHLGLTLAGLTGEVVAEFAQGRTPSIDMTAVDWRRFGT